MNKRLIVIWIIGMCAMNACGNEKEDDDFTNGDLKCVPEFFVSSCQTSKRHTECVDNKIVYKSCPGNTVCDEGVCIEALQNCSQQDYRTTCKDKMHYTHCHDEGYVETLECDTGSECVYGACHPKGCRDDGCLCDAEAFASSCEGDVLVSCHRGFVMKYRCADDGLTCDEGQCKSIGMIECDEASQAGKCIGDTVVRCLDFDSVLDSPKNGLGNVTAINCGVLFNNAGICAIIGGEANCYPPCHEDDLKKDKIQICSDDAPSAYYSGKCIRVSNGAYALNNNLPGYCSGDHSKMCKNNKCVENTLFETKCNPKTDKNFCDGFMLNYCNEDGYFEVKSCALDLLHEYEECLEIDGIADCYEPCKTEGDFYFSYKDYISINSEAFRYECTKTPNGLYYVPEPIKCYAILDSSGNEAGSLLSFSLKGKICVQKEATATDSHCDGNVAILYDSFIIRDNDHSEIKDFEIPFDCGTQSCVVYKNKAVCADTCTAKDVGKTKYTCTIDDIKEVFISQSYRCTKVEDKYYWLLQSTSKCGHGCSEKQGCKNIHPSEGMDCSQADNIDFQNNGQMCDNNIYLSCNNDNIIEAYDCGMKKCAILEDKYGCF